MVLSGIKMTKYIQMKNPSTGLMLGWIYAPNFKFGKKSVWCDSLHVSSGPRQDSLICWNVDPEPLQVRQTVPGDDHLCTLPLDHLARLTLQVTHPPPP